MGNCQAAEVAAATVVIVHPGGYNKVQRLYCSVTARDVMNSNPGHYVALVVKTEDNGGGLPVKRHQLKILNPGQTLLIGHVYRLITYQDVLKEFAANKCMKLGRLLMETGVIQAIRNNHTNSVKNGSRRGHGGRKQHQSGDGRQWKPALKSISELGN